MSSRRHTKSKSKMSKLPTLGGSRHKKHHYHSESSDGPSPKTLSKMFSKRDLHKKFKKFQKTYKKRKVASSDSETSDSSSDDEPVIPPSRKKQHRRFDQSEDAKKERLSHLKGNNVVLENRNTGGKIAFTSLTKAYRSCFPDIGDPHNKGHNMQTIPKFLNSITNKRGKRLYDVYINGKLSDAPSVAPQLAWRGTSLEWRKSNPDWKKQFPDWVRNIPEQPKSRRPHTASTKAQLLEENKKLQHTIDQLRFRLHGDSEEDDGDSEEDDGEVKTKIRARTNVLIDSDDEDATLSPDLLAPDPLTPPSTMMPAIRVKQEPLSPTLAPIPSHTHSKISFETKDVCDFLKVLPQSSLPPPRPPSSILFGGKVNPTAEAAFRSRAADLNISEEPDTDNIDIDWLNV